MNCPRCVSSELHERDREGITIDVCPRCRGLWLDRGELEKLIARTARDYDNYEARGRRDSTPPGAYYEDHDRGRHGKRKRSFLESLGDIFD